MTPEKLVNPFIIYWDLPSSGGGGGTVLRICKELIEARPFVVDFLDNSSGLIDEKREILQQMSKKGIKINYTTGVSAIGNPVCFVKETGIKKLFIEMEPGGEIFEVLDKVREMYDKGCPVGISVRLDRDSIRQLPDFLALCIEKGVREIIFPIQRAGNKNMFYIEPVDLRGLSQEVSKIEVERLSLSIHDPFLWKILHKKENPNEEGCNAAKTMCYISEDFQVLPCPIYPFPLGSLLNFSVKEIFSSDRRKEVRNAISGIPDECMSCAEVSRCKGGCRGRAYAVSGRVDLKDPSCCFSHYF